MHYSVEVPLNIKALLFVPQKNQDMFSMMEEKISIDLYSRKILISKDCKELLPNYLRFMKGVVDCEDLPLNISRENYQDSNLMVKLKSLLTKRVLRMFQEKAKRDPQEYKEFYKAYNMNIKEGLHSDPENQKVLLDLVRFDSSIGKFISLSDYKQNIKEGQDKIYFFLSHSAEMADNSAYMEPFKKFNIPVLYLSVNVEEMVLTQLGQFEGCQFINIESPNLVIPKNLLKDGNESVISEFELPTEERQNLCLWIRNELQPMVSNVVISDKLVDSPLMVTSMMSSGMRQMMSMMDQNFDTNQFNQNLTMELNSQHETIYKLNLLRKRNVKAANSLLRHLLDNSLMNAGIPFDTKTFMKRMNLFILKLADYELEGSPKIEEGFTEPEVMNLENEEIDSEETDSEFKSSTDNLAEALKNLEGLKNDMDSQSK